MLVSLKSDPEKGLSSSEARNRLHKYGPNQLQEEKGKSAFMIFISQFLNIMTALLIVATGLSLWFKEYLDATAISIVILLNAIIGFVMEYQAKRSMEALKKISGFKAKVIRDGKLQEIPSVNLVPGDIQFIESGDVISADSRIFDVTQLSINESVLTGESLPVEKTDSVLNKETQLADRTNMVFSGTFVTGGNAKAIVVGTGMKTELGNIAGLVHTAEQSATPLEKKLQSFSLRLTYITLGLMALIFTVGLIIGENIRELISSSIALAVAAIPEGLPIVATLALARGVIKMSSRHVIVKRLSAVETLGGTTVICSDKTGTLTQNKIVVSEIVNADENSEFNRDIMFKIAVLCNTAVIDHENSKHKGIGDPLETGLLNYAKGQGIDIQKLRKQFPKLKENPFSSESKMMSSLHKIDSDHIVLVKGAVEEVLKLCDKIIKGDKEIELDKAEIKSWHTEMEKFANEGSRVIAGAYKWTKSKNEISTDKLTFAGLFLMNDPIAKGVVDAIKECHDAGIKVIMITGDHPGTALNVAKQLGITNDKKTLIIGKEMSEFSSLNKKQKDHWNETLVFARVSPVHKLDLVQVLQEKGNIVGMTGDGVNDAPALKKADIGIAMGKRGTQVAQEAADMILRDDSFASISYAIKQGRIIFGNIQKFVTYLLSCNLSELFVISLASLANLHFQLFPIQILFINLITDVLPAMALGMSEGDSTVMKKPPLSPKSPILSKAMWRNVWIYAAVMSVSTIGAVYLSHIIFHSGEKVNPELSNNILFYTLMLSQLLHVFNMSVKRFDFFKGEVVRNKNVWFALLICCAILIVFAVIPTLSKVLHIASISIYDWLIVVACSLISLFLSELIKIEDK